MIEITNTPTVFASAQPFSQALTVYVIWPTGVVAFERPDNPRFSDMDPLHFCIIVTPLSVYMLLLGLINLRGRPFVTTGARDTAALAIGLIGLVIAGPMQLFFPEGAASQFGAWVWLMLVVFYGLCVSLSVLLMRSRIVIYNVSMEQLRPILTSVAMKLDKGSRWTGDSLQLPDVKIHMHVEPVNWIKNVQLTAVGNHQSYEGWRVFEIELNKALKKIVVGPNLFGFPLLIMSGAIALTAVIWMLSDKLAVAKAFEEFWRM